MPEFNRRQLFKLRLADLTRVIGKGIAKGGRMDEEPEPSWLPRPPGALEDDSVFLDTCERCSACASACPYEAIDHYGPDAGRREGTPFIDPAKSPCHWCEDMPCINACPSGALSRAPDQPVPPIGKVTLNFDRCLNAQGILCDTCSYRCPTHVGAIRMAGRRPELDFGRCTGCGMCLFHCEAEPSAFDCRPSSQPTTATNPTSTG